uniref:Uncharacterized protein n=1 Tax=Daphnia galeata TaxID=27404 RepID=A0A8J2RWI6_9CRUS|nr:unnamed protein product [Daphnia galeata]
METQTVKECGVSIRETTNANNIELCGNSNQLKHANVLLHLIQSQQTKIIFNQPTNSPNNWQQFKACHNEIYNLNLELHIIKRQILPPKAIFATRHCSVMGETFNAHMGKLMNEYWMVWIDLLIIITIK